jgi:hypothetical protein
MKSLLHLLGAMLVYEDFETQMKENPHPTLNAWGLSPEEKDVAARLVESFRDGKMADATRAVRAECPNWPCN